MDTEEDTYKALPQIRGSVAHTGVDNRQGSTRATDILGMSIYSEELGICGKIDVYKGSQFWLIERKYNLKKIFQGQIYQLWAQYFCMTEMGYEVRKIAFYEISTNKMTEISLPTMENKQELQTFIKRFQSYQPLIDKIEINPNKCKHCIYCNLCDKTGMENVYA